MTRPDPILVTGAARSGTSMSAGILDHCGAFGGDTTPPLNHNKKGQFENDVIRSKILKPYLASIGADPKGQFPLPDIDTLKPCQELKDKVLQTMDEQGYTGGPWYYKGAKLCLLWPVWHQLFPNAKWIIVRREDDDIVSSCMKTHFMNYYKTEEGWQTWVDEHKIRFKQMHEAGLEIIEVWPTRFIDGEFSEIRKLIEEVGLEWNAQAVSDFVTPELWNT